MSYTRVLRSAAALLALALLGQAANAQGAADWPNRTVRLIVNFGPGGSIDNSMRPFADRLSRALGQQFVVDNRGGASGALGIEAAVKSPPDGYTFVATPSLSVVILPHLRKTPYDPLKDLVPVTQFTDGTLLFAVHPSVPANSLQEFVAYAKSNPGKLSWGTAGVGSAGHLLCEAFKLQAGVDILHVPYRGGGESLADFLAGVVQIHADPNTMPHVSAGKAKLLAVLDRNRRPDFPDVPLLKEIYPELDFLAWFALFAPPGTPPAIVRRMSEAMNTAARDPELRPLLLKTALAPNPGTPEELDALLRKDHERYGNLVRKLNLRMD
jgi:tripartite-type tricarboxylate transporter receptor subunit TctC